MVAKIRPHHLGTGGSDFLSCLKIYLGTEVLDSTVGDSYAAVYCLEFFFGNSRVLPCKSRRLVGTQRIGECMKLDLHTRYPSSAFVVCFFGNSLHRCAKFLYNHPADIFIVSCCLRIFLFHFFLKKSRDSFYYLL